ncbi:MAG: peptidoglycan editing factor PgeF [Alphaproteobacteria bacterium]|nr:peptidoglycan editing factor PgeF [Alphaproteobacteria bacterium]
MIEAEDLTLPGIAHGFFTREGGFSSGLFASLNAGLGSGDDLEHVRQNRALVSARLGVAAEKLVTPYQVHGNEVAVVSGPVLERPRVDGLVTATPGVAIGVLTADCGPVLFADAEARVVGACHAGWKGALSGVFRSTVEVMESLGARRDRMVAVLGPTISQANYEVGPDFPNPFLEGNAGRAQYFTPSIKEGHHMFDLPRFLVDEMKALGLGLVRDLALCTYENEEWFYSYRRATHRKENDYGRLISAIALQG